MHRIDGPGSTQDKRFTEGDPTAGIPPTIVTADWANSVQEELLAVIEGAGIAANKAARDQLKLAIMSMVTSRLPQQATTESAGIVERATDAEVQAGTDGERYVTPKQVVSALRDTFAGCIVEWECETIPTLADGKPLGIELNGDIASLALLPRLLRKWCGAAKNATAPAWYRCNASGVRDAAGDHIRLQDRRGEFARGWDHGRGIDAGRMLGSAQESSRIFETIGTIGSGAASSAAVGVASHDGVVTYTETGYIAIQETGGSFAATSYALRTRNISTIFLVLI